MRNAAFAFLHMAVALIMPSSISAAPSPPTHSFTIKDLIGWTTVVPFAATAPGSTNGNSQVALFSPTANLFVIHVRTADPVTDSVREQLRLFRSSQVRGFLREHSSTPPQGRIILDLHVHDADGLSSVVWTDATHLALIAEGANHVPQIYLVNVVTAHARQLTHSRTAVMSFAVSGNELLFYARLPAEPLPKADVVGDRSLGQILFEEEGQALTPIALYRQSIKTGRVFRLGAPPSYIARPFQRIWISPDQKRAIIFIPATDAPSAWANYKVHDYPRLGYTADYKTGDPTSPLLVYRTRYAVVNLANGKVTPLLDAPSGWLTSNLTPIDVFWLDDDRVIVSNTFLPIESDAAIELAQRRRSPAIADISIATGEIRVVAWEPVLTDDEHLAGMRQPFAISDIAWLPENKTIHLVIRRRQSPGSSTFIASAQDISLGKGVWRAGPVLSLPNAHALTITLEQALNKRPKLYAAADSAKAEFADLNPEAAGTAFGHVEEAAWQDLAAKIVWHGALIYPVNYRPGEQYPLIVQTHGYDSGEFLLSGPLGANTAMAAQVFAGAGFFVLQVEDNLHAVTERPDEGIKVSDGYKAGIDWLVAHNLVDPDRVGLISWSRTGWAADFLIARYPDLLKAAYIADSAQPAYLSSVLLDPSNHDMQRWLGATIDYSNPGAWFERSPLYHLRHPNTAIRLEAPDRPQILGLWETYVVLKAEKYPTEFVYTAHGRHNQFLPAERFVSQGGSIDWFRFWLQGYEDSDPAKREQYVRWERLCDLQRSENSTQPSFCVPRPVH